MADKDKNGRVESSRGPAQAPGGLPVHELTGATGDWGFASGEAFWRRVAELSTELNPAAHLDAAMRGKASPRVWLIAHRPGENELGALLALSFARELGGRGQATIVLDGDDREQCLTRWGERLEADGWIDLARYGVSVMAAGLPLPFEGRQGYLLGVGSFAPTDITRAEIDQMMARLRRQADDVIVVVPTDEDAARWAPVANLRLLCWNRPAGSEAEIADLAVAWQAAGHPLTGLVGFGAESDPDGAAETVAADMKPDEVASAGAEAEGGTTEPQAPGAPADSSHPPESPSEEVVAKVVEPAAPDEEPTEPAAASDTGRQRTSGVFWFVLTAAVVVVGMLGLYWYQYVRVPAAETGQPPTLADTEVSRPAASIAAGELANQDGGATAGEERSLAATADSVARDSLGLAGAAGGADTLDVAAGALPDSAAAAVPAAGTEPATVELSPDAPDSTAEAGFSLEPYRTEVGAAGWALHLYSLPNEAAVEVELTEMHRRGFETAVRMVETKDKGRWWRVYVGSFPSRAEAKRAAVLLKEELRTDWANPVRF